MNTSTTTAGDPGRRLPRPFMAAALAAAVLLLPACAPAAAPSTEDAQPTVAASADAPSAAVQTRAPSSDPDIDGRASPAAEPSPSARTDIPLRPAAPSAAPAPTPSPTFLTVAGTSINMTVVPVGVSSGGAMEIPDPFDQAGWYRYGAAPGAPAGTAVIAAHVDTTSESAPFSQLKYLTAGTSVRVERQGAAALTYRVVSVELMAKDRFDGAAVFRRSGAHELKLVTCGGKWLDEKLDYSDNVIVTAVLE
ncbi:class F sortase [Arthrobacter sp. SA17]